MIKYLDKAFARIAKLSGHPYIILLTANICIFSTMYFAEGAVDITISISTLVLDMIIINQGNKTSSQNAKTLTTIIRMEEGVTKKLDALHCRMDNLAVAIKMKKPRRDKHGRFI